MGPKHALLTVTMLLASTTTAEPSNTYGIFDLAVYSHLRPLADSYTATLTRDPAYASISSVIATALPTSITVPDLYAVVNAGAFTTDPWFSNLPSGPKSWIYKLASEQSSLFTVAAAQAMLTVASAPSGYFVTSVMTTVTPTGAANSPSTTPPTQTSTATQSSSSAIAKPNDATRSANVFVRQGFATVVVVAIGALAFIL